MRCSICYDIGDDKRRRQIVKILLTYMYRVQESVFEGIISQSSLDEIRRKVREVLDFQEDTMRIYLFCNDCGQKTDIIGVGEKVEQVEYVIL